MNGSKRGLKDDSKRCPNDSQLMIIRQRDEGMVAMLLGGKIIKYWSCTWCNYSEDMK